MTAERVRHYLEKIPRWRVRALFPSGDGAALGLAGNYRCNDEAAALIDPEAQAIIARRGIEIMPFAGLEHAA